MPLRWALRNLSSKTRFYGEIADGYLGFLLAPRSYTSFSGEKPLKLCSGFPVASKVWSFLLPSFTPLQWALSVLNSVWFDADEWFISGLLVLFMFPFWVYFLSCHKFLPYFGMGLWVQVLFYFELYFWQVCCFQNWVSFCLIGVWWNFCRKHYVYPV